MSTADDNTKYYIRIRGRVLGPYSIKQLNILRERGQLSESNEISTDTQSWASAATLAIPFGAPPKKSQKKGAASGDLPQLTASEGDAAPWHYSIDGEQHGPVTLKELHELLEMGRLNLRDLVWKQGMEEWTAAAEIAELNQSREFEKTARTKPARRGSTDEVAISRDKLATHFLDHVLKGLRSVVNEWFISAVGKGSIELGRYAIYLSILLNLAFCVLAAVKINNLDTGLIGVGFSAVALVLQYSAVKSCGALNQTIRSISLRMSSAAFLDSIVVMMLVGGIVALATSAVLWMRFRETPIIVIGIGICCLCEQLGLMLLYPREVGITISSRASTGEEAIAILSFFMILPLRFVPAVFGIGSILSISGTLIAFYLLLTASPSGSYADIADAVRFAMTSAAAALYCCVFPFAMYVYFVFAYLAVDVIRSILVMPDKVDQLTQQLARNNGENDFGDGRQSLASESD